MRQIILVGFHSQFRVQSNSRLRGCSERENGGKLQLPSAGHEVFTDVLPRSTYSQDVEKERWLPRINLRAQQSISRLLLASQAGAAQVEPVEDVAWLQRGGVIKQHEELTADSKKVREELLKRLLGKRPPLQSGFRQ